MQHPPPERPREERPADGERRHDDTDRSLKEAVEAAASAYFSACRKLARAINRLKQG